MNKKRSSLDNLEELKEVLKELIKNARSIIDLEKKFVDEVTKVRSALYSPVKDWGKSESNNGIEYFSNINKALILEEEKFDNINKKINDPNINIALFGDVSAGKSQTINAILGRRLFIPVYCNGTICFVKISLLPSDKKVETIETPNNKVIECTSDDDMRTKVKEFANYNGTMKLKEHEILRINLKLGEKDFIMRENVALMDCPGGNSSVEVAKRIKDVVKDADIFLFIFNQVLFEQQRIFFCELLKVTSSPNVFVLINKWDETDNDDPTDVNRVYTSTKREIEAWLREVDTDYNGESGERIFFVSANETLQQKIEDVRFNEDVLDNHKRRLDEFKTFERILGEHLDNGKEIKIAKNNTELENMKTRIGFIKNGCNEEIRKIMEKKKKGRLMIQTKMEDVNKCKKELVQYVEENMKSVDYDIDKCYGQLLNEINMRFSQYIEDETLRYKPKKSWYSFAISLDFLHKREDKKLNDKGQISDDTAKSSLNEEGIILSEKQTLKKLNNYLQQYCKITYDLPNEKLKHEESAFITSYGNPNITSMSSLLNDIINQFNDQYRREIFSKLNKSLQLDEIEELLIDCITCILSIIGRQHSLMANKPTKFGHMIIDYLSDLGEARISNNMPTRFEEICLHSLCNVIKYVKDDMPHNFLVVLIEYFSNSRDENIKLYSACLLAILAVYQVYESFENLIKKLIPYLHNIVKHVNKYKTYLGLSMDFIHKSLATVEFVERVYSFLRKSEDEIIGPLKDELKPYDDYVIAMETITRNQDAMKY